MLNDSSSDENKEYMTTESCDKILEIINSKITNISEIVEFINFNLETIILNFNNIVVCDLTLLPDNIINIVIENNLVEIEEILFNTKHEWKNIILKNSNIKKICEINNLVCNKLDLTDNELTTITLNNCKISSLYLSENRLDNIKFNNCEIKIIDLSDNRIEEIENFPDNLVNLNFSNNLLSKINNLPESIKKLNLSQNIIENIETLPSNIEVLEITDNRLSTFNINLLSKNIKHFDITNNCIKNNSELFGELQAEKLYYDTDSEDDDDSDIEIKFSNFRYNNNEFKESEKNEIRRVFDNTTPVQMKWKVRL